MSSFQGLVRNAEEAADACRGEGNLEKLGGYLSTYWEQKKRMAPGEFCCLHLVLADNQFHTPLSTVDGGMFCKACESSVLYCKAQRWPPATLD